jgi:hypothetical protein
MKETLNLNYIQQPLGIAVMALRGDLLTANGNLHEIQLIRAHWNLAERYFRTMRIKGKNKNVKLLNTDTYTIQDTWLQIAQNSLEEYEY